MRHETIETDRLILRPITMADAPDMFANWASDPEVTRFLSWSPYTDVAAVEKRIAIWLQEDRAPGAYRYVITERGVGKAIGMISTVGLHHGNPVIGYCLGRPWWGRGYMTEACKALMNTLLDDGFTTLVIEAAQANRGSNRVIQKCGFELVGTWLAPICASKPEPIEKNSYRYFSTPRRSGTYTDENASTIDRWIEEGWEWGIPVDRKAVRLARRGQWSVNLTPTRKVPRWWFGDIKGKRVLGLASGGGQQIPLFAAAGAECWVLDYSQKQIDSEKLVAAREKLDVRAIRADMTQTLPFSDSFFDIVFHPVSNCYIKDVQHVWDECARVLKPGGRLLSGLDNGINYLFDGDDESAVTGYLPFDPLQNPRQMKSLADSDCGVQFSHTIEEQIGGQLRAGFRLEDIYQDTNGEGLLHEHGAPCFFATLAVRF